MESLGVTNISTRTMMLPIQATCSHQPAIAILSSAASSRTTHTRRHLAAGGSGSARPWPLRRLRRGRFPILAANALAKRRAVAFSAGVVARSLAIRRKASRVLWSAPMSAFRIGHGVFQALDCAGSKADELGCLEHTRTLGEFAARGLEFFGVCVGTAQTLSNLAGLAGEVTVTGNGIFGTG